MQIDQQMQLMYLKTIAAILLLKIQVKILKFLNKITNNLLNNKWIQIFHRHLLWIFLKHLKWMFLKHLQWIFLNHLLLTSLKLLKCKPLLKEITHHLLKEEEVNIKSYIQQLKNILILIDLKVLCLMKLEIQKSNWEKLLLL